MTGEVSLVDQLETPAIEKRRLKLFSFGVHQLPPFSGGVGCGRPGGVAFKRSIPSSWLKSHLALAAAPMVLVASSFRSQRPSFVVFAFIRYDSFGFSLPH